jgi:transcriptional regulator with XRE-family HTH domain
LETISVQRFGSVVRARRRQLDLTQEEVARRIKTSVPYIGYLESQKRHPSAQVVIKLARVLGLDQRELFFLANPETKTLVFQHPESDRPSAWDGFAKNENLHKLHNITSQEMQTLSQVALMGQVRSSHDFIYILIVIRHALGQ